MRRQGVVFDTCIVIDLMEKPAFGQKLRKALRGKPIGLVLCDTVFREVRRVCGFDACYTLAKVQKIFGKVVETVSTERYSADAERVSAKFHTCHRGDSSILALCRGDSLLLVTRDRALHRACECAGVLAFYPYEARQI